MNPSPPIAFNDLTENDVPGLSSLFPQIPSPRWPNSKRPHPAWVDAHCTREDGGEHEGTVELIIWEPGSGDEKLGWGNCYADESDEMKQKFDTEFNSSHEKLYEYWPQALRRTCCGTDGDQSLGCDHHGIGTECL